MALAFGTKLGPYEVHAPLGAGGMGEVYSARDTRLDRTVAIKILPSHLSDNPEARQRFDREARAISSLNHPNICTLYDVGSEAGIDYLVMEYLEGETLEIRLVRGPLALNQAVEYAIRIADALDKAHRQGLVHRDLKPGNVMLTKVGAKLMDFGLAKLRKERSIISTALAEAKTVETKSLTTEGTIIGSLQYMAPEQLEGKEADVLSDIFAFGALLYEMLTGKPAFAGKSKASQIAAILSSEPTSMSSLQPATPLAMERLVGTCLAKDRDDRWRDAHDLKLQLEWIRDERSPISERQKIAQGMPVAQPEMRAVRAYVLPPEKSSFLFTGPNAGPVVVSPDGRRLAFTASHREHTRLFVRPIDSLVAQSLPGTEGASFPFWSPDSRSLGFFADGNLRTIEFSGGPPQTLCDAPAGRGGSWNRDGTIIFAPTPMDRIYRIPAAGGSRQPVTTLDPANITTNRWPYFLPDGRHFLYFGGHPLSNGGIYVGCLDGNEQKLIFHSYFNAIYAPPGFLLFARDGKLVAHGFDTQSLETHGDDFPVAEQVMVDAWIHRAIFSTSETGVLVYQRGAAVVTSPRLIWFNRGGKPDSAPVDPASYVWHQLSADGRKLVVADRFGGGSNVWILDLRRGIKTRLTFDPYVKSFPLWSPDGTRVVFSSNRSGQFHIYQKASNGVGEEELLFDSGAEERVESWSPDGKYLAYLRRGTDKPGAADIWILPLSARRKPFPFIEGEFDKAFPSFSPDGRWVAYASNESGRFEIYVAPFPNAKGKWQISTSGGTFPRWSGDGNELFYLGPDNRLRATGIIGRKSSLGVGSTQVLFAVQAAPPPASPFDVSADGKRFLINTVAATQGGSEPITLVINWPTSAPRTLINAQPA